MTTETQSPPNLSERELQVLRLVATGASNSQIARELTISVNTVKVHLNNIFAKIGVQSRTEAALFAVRHGWVEVKRADGTLTGSSEQPVAPVFADRDLQTSGAASEAVLDGGAAAAAETRPVRLPVRRLAVVAVALILLLMLYPLLSTTEAWRTYFGPRPESQPAPAINAPPRWAAKAALPSPRDGIAAVAAGGLIYAIAGAGEDKVLDDVTAYDPTTNVWVNKSPKPTAVQGAGAAVISGRVYVPGGCDHRDQPTAGMEVYDPERDTWQTGVPLPTAVCRYALSAVEGRLYVFGGWDGSRELANVFVFDPVRAQWSEQSPLPAPRSDARSAVVNDRVYIVGGQNGGRLLNETLAFDATQERSSAKVWATKSDMQYARAYFGLVSLAGNLYVFGGASPDALTENERYDSKNDQWSSVDNSLEVLQRVGGAVALETKIYLLGGWNGRPTAAVQEYTALYRFFVPNFPPRP